MSVLPSHNQIYGYSKNVQAVNARCPRHVLEAPSRKAHQKGKRVREKRWSPVTKAHIHPPQQQTGALSG